MYLARFLAAAFTLVVCAFGAECVKCQTPADTFTARLAVATEYAVGHRWAEAIVAFESAIQINPRNAEAFNGLGEAHLALAQYREALKAFRRAAEIDRDISATHYNLGLTLMKMHRYAAAVDAYWAAVGIAPDDAPARFGLAEAYLKLGKNDMALMQHEKLKEIDKNLAAQLFRDIYFRNAADAEPGFDSSTRR